MLTWMQKHKKRLVIIIWISTIAFVGAGFVGWGSYDLNLNRSSSLAKVGQEKVSFEEFNLRYNQYLNFYKQINNDFDEQKAKESGLDFVVLDSLINEKLLINFAKDIGLNVSNDEIINVLLNQKEFFDENGVFNKDIYYKLLANANLKPKQYENLLSNDILLNKINLFLNTNNSQKELDMISSSYFLQDDIDILVLNAEPLKNIKIDENKLAKLWQEHKSDFLVPKHYLISSFFIPIEDKKIDDIKLKEFYEKNKAKYTDFTGKILSFDKAKDEIKISYSLEQIKDKANQTYIKLNNKELNFNQDLTIYDNDIYYPIELFDGAKDGAILKPFVFNKDGKDGYMIVRINSINDTRIKSFDEARTDLIPLYEKMIKLENLKTQAQKKLSNFKGQNLGFVSQDSKKSDYKIININDDDFSLFLNKLFDSNLKKSFVLLEDKAILYNINKQKLSNNNKTKQYFSDISNTLTKIKSIQIGQILLNKLKNEYNIEIYYKGDES